MVGKLKLKFKKNLKETLRKFLKIWRKFCGKTVNFDVCAGYYSYQLSENLYKVEGFPCILLKRSHLSIFLSVKSVRLAKAVMSL